MADLFPDVALFDELEFLRFSDEQFASEVILPEDTQQTSLFSAPPLGSTKSHDGSCNSSSPHALTELKSAVASCTVGIYRSPEPDSVGAKSIRIEEKTLNEVFTGASDRDAMSRKLSWSYDSSEEADVTSPVSFSAVSEMSPVDANMELIQSAEVSQTASSLDETPIPMVQDGRQRRLKVWRKPLHSQVRTYSKSGAAGCSYQTLKRKLSVTAEETTDRRFKTSKKTKKYLEKPYADPDMERTRLNAINAKKNRDRKKEEMLMLSQKCDALSRDNRELDKNNRSLEARLHAAEEEIAFLRRALLGKVGSARPALGDALKSLGGGDSAPAGVCGVGGKDV